jgi:3-oxoacyl-[acyl-carrier protein] reductase
MENLMDMMGRTAIVTGASRGIGRAICLQLAHSGCNIAFNYSRSADAAAQLVSDIKSMGRAAQAYHADVRSLDAAEAMVRAVKDKYGRIDYLINNAGITRDQLVLRMSETEWDEVIDTNLKGAFCFSKAVIRPMMRARFGSILNITSISGLVGMPGQANYSASKAGLIGFTKALAKETAGRNVTVNALALGFVSTDMTQSIPQDFRDTLLKNIPLGRFGTVEEVGKIAAFLLSDDARYITGQVIHVDGGLAI